MKCYYHSDRTESQSFNSVLGLCFIISTVLVLNLSLKGQNVTHNYASNSILSSGIWGKISVYGTGICKVTYEDMMLMELPVSGALSSNIRIHGYSGVLPEVAGIKRYDDVPEISIMVSDGGDGFFNQGDYLLFYTPGPNSWKYNSQTGTFDYLVNVYSDSSYYFVTIGDRSGKRIAQMQQPSQTNIEARYYNHRDIVSPELENLIKSGRGWYGDLYDIITERDYQFEEIATKEGSLINIRFSAVARSFWGSTFTLTINNTEHTLPIASVPNDFNSNYAHITTNRFIQPAAGIFNNAVVKYNKSTNMDLGWLNFIEINAEAKLKYNNKPLGFRNIDLTGDIEYIIEGVNNNIFLWDVTNQIAPGILNKTIQNSILRFNVSQDSLREYLITEPSQFIRPNSFQKLSNQNLHAMSTPEMLIITHPDFMPEAVRLATYHANSDDLSVSVVTPQAIYNEFSSGSQDISAIRDFIKMLWHKAEGNNLPRYVLLFGDASYDFKDRIASNTNFIPTFQSHESLNPVNSIATDDFFVCIDDQEGGKSSDIIDIGIGRLPVQTIEEARLAVDKIIHYVEDTEKVTGEWRNVIAFVADDEDGNIHMSQADQIATMIDTTFKNYNTDKIFLDAYQQESTAGGQRSPDANAAINQRVAKGALIINYTGHGGETGWTKEQILEVSDINSWTNYNRLPVFMTATCEFSRYDDPQRVSGGEYAFLSKNGGAIALFTTARPTYGTPNFALAKIFYSTALQPMNGSMPRLGDIIRISKQIVGSDNNDNNKKFVLLGDPAMTMAYPKHKILTTEFNGVPVGFGSDTLKALQLVTIKGIIANSEGNKIDTFNGTILPTVYDKKSEIVTYGTEGAGPMTFSLWRNVIYKGRAEVRNGEFVFSFIVPKDIAYNYGLGKISYYASDGVTDASGNHSEVVIGGFYDNAVVDNDGPDVRLFINDSTFKDGGFTDENPVLLAYITDSSGINTLGNSIGHDLVAILDDDSQHPYILNDYYKADLGTYKSGSVMFPIKNLQPGPHVLRMRLWDVHNNSSEAEIRFIVASGNNIILSEIDAWPNPINRDNGPINFIIGHNQAGKELKAELSIYTLSGKQVSVASRSIFAEGYRTPLFSWNGRSSDGQKLSPGFYIANIRIQTPEGYVSDKSVKLIIAR